MSSLACEEQLPPDEDDYAGAGPRPVQPQQIAPTIVRPLAQSPAAQHQSAFTPTIFGQNTMVSRPISNLSATAAAPASVIQHSTTFQQVDLSEPTSSAAGYVPPHRTKPYVRQPATTNMTPGTAARVALRHTGTGGGSTSPQQFVTPPIASPTPPSSSASMLVNDGSRRNPSGGTPGAVPNAVSRGLISEVDRPVGLATRPGYQQRTYIDQRAPAPTISSPSTSAALTATFPTADHNNGLLMNTPGLQQVLPMVARQLMLTNGVRYPTSTPPLSGPHVIGFPAAGNSTGAVTSADSVASMFVKPDVTQAMVAAAAAAAAAAAGGGNPSQEEVHAELFHLDYAPYLNSDSSHHHHHHHHHHQLLLEDHQQSQSQQRIESPYNSQPGSQPHVAATPSPKPSILRRRGGPGDLQASAAKKRLALAAAAAQITTPGSLPVTPGGTASVSPAIDSTNSQPSVAAAAGTATTADPAGSTETSPKKRQRKQQFDNADATADLKMELVFPTADQLGPALMSKLSPESRKAVMELTADRKRRGRPPRSRETGGSHHRSSSARQGGGGGVGGNGQQQRSVYVELDETASHAQLGHVLPRSLSALAAGVSQQDVTAALVEEARADRIRQEAKRAARRNDHQSASPLAHRRNSSADQLRARMDAGEAGGLAQGPFIPDDASCSGTPDKVLSQKSRTPTVPTAARRKITAFAPLNLELLAQAGSFKKRRSSGKKNGEEEEKGEEGKTKTKRAPILDKESPPRRRRRIDLDELAEAEQAMTAADLLSTGWRNAVVSTNRRDRSLDCDLLDENEEDGLTWRRMASICKRQSDDIRQPKTSWASEASKQEAAFELQPTWKQKRIGALVSRMLFRQKDLAPASDNLVDQLRLVLKRRVDKEVADSVHSTLQHQIEAHRPLVDVPRRGGTKVVRRLHELIETKHPWLGELLRLRESVAAEQGTQRKERVKAEAADTKQSPSVLGGHIMRVVSAIDEPSSSTSYQGGSIRVYDGTTNPEHWDRPQSMAEGKLAARISRLRRQEILRSMGFNLQVVHVDAEKKLPGVIVVEDDAKVADLEQSHMVPAATSGDSKRIPLSARHPKIVAGLLADLQDDQSISERARSRLFAARLRAEARCWVFQRARTAVDRKRHRRLRMVSTQANWRHLQTASKFASIRSPSEREIWRVVKFAHGSLRRALQIARTSASGLDVAPVTRRETSDSGELTFVDTSKNQDISLPVVLRSVVRRGDVLQSPSGRTAEERLARDEALQDRLVVEEVLDSVVSFVAAQVDRQFEPLDLANRSRIRSNTRQPQLSSSADDHRPSTSKTAENDEEAISARRADLVAKIKRRVQISRALMDAVAEHGAEKHPDDDPGTDREGISISKSDVSAMRERFSGIFGKKLAARRRRRRRRSDGSDSGAASTSEDEDDKEGGRNVVDAGPAVESPNFRAAVSSRILLQRRLERLDRLVADQLAWEQRLLCAWIDYLRAAEPHTYWALVKDVQRDVDSAERDETIVARRYARFVEVLLRVPVDRAVQKRAQFGEVTESVDLLPSAWQINQALGPLSPYWRGAAPCPLDESEPSFVDRRGQLSFERPDDWKPAPNPFRQLYIEDLAECRYISASDLSRAIERADGSVEKLERIVGGDVGQPRNGEEHSSRGTARLHDVLATLAFDEIPLDNVEKSATEEEEEGDGGGGLQSIAMRPTKLQRPPDPPGRIPPDVQAQRDRLREQFATAVQVARQASQFTSQLRDAVRALVDRHFRERRLHRRWVDENIADRDEDDAKNQKKATARSVKQPEKVETARELAERLAREVEDEDSDDEEGSGVGPQEPSVPIEYDDSRRVQLLLTVDWLKRLARLEGVPREREDASPPPPARLVSFHELVQRHREARESDPNYQNRYQNHHRQQSSPVVLNSSDERSSRASKPRPRGGPNNSHSRRRMPQSTSSNSVADTFKRLLTAPP